MTRPRLTPVADTASTAATGPSAPETGADHRGRAPSPGSEVPDAGAIAADPVRTAREGVPVPSRTLWNDAVDVATGAVRLARTDLHLPGDPPLELTRTHSSQWTRGHWFGRSWSSTFDERVDLYVAGSGERSAVVVRADASAQVFALREAGATARPVAGGTTVLRRTSDGWDLLDVVTGLTRHYPAPAGGRAWLGSITDTAGHRVSILRDDRGAPFEMVHSGGYRVLVGTEGDRVTRLTVVDAAGLQPVRIAAYTYDSAGDLTGVADESGVPQDHVYVEHRLVQRRDRTGAVTTFDYDDEGRCVRQDGSRRAGFEHGRGPRDLVRTTVTDGCGAVRSFLVNGRFQVVGRRDPLGHETRWEWDTDNRLLACTDPLGRTTRHSYDAAGNHVVLTRPDGSHRVTEWVSTPAGPRPDRVALPDGAVWSYAYDEIGRPVSVTDPEGATTAYGYDGRGHLASVIDPLARLRQVETDGAGLPTRVVEADGRLTETDRDHLGRVVAVTDALGARTEYDWTPSGRVAARRLPDGSAESWTYDGEGNPVTFTDGAGRVTRTRFADGGVPVEVTAPDGTVTGYEYDAEQRLVAVSGPRGAVLVRTYDAAGRLVAETDPDGRESTFAHDAAGRLVGRTNGAGQRIVHGYDDLDNEVTRQVGPTTTRMEYDALGRLLRATSPEVDLVLERDLLGRVVAESVDGRRLETVYDALGRPVRRTTPAGVVTEWTYGAGAGPERVVVAGQEVGFEHDLAGRETRRRVGDLVLDRTWDPLGRLLGQRVERGPRPDGVSLAERFSGVVPVDPLPDVVQERRLTYAPGGLLVRVEDRIDGVRRLEHDAAGRVVSVASEDGEVEVYDHDPLGNITRAAGASGDAERREYVGTLLVRAGRTRYFYDAHGRPVRQRRVRAGGQVETWRYEWDAADRLVGVRTPDGCRWSYVYDALGRRVAKRRRRPGGKVAEEVRLTWDGFVLVEQTSRSGQTLSWAYVGSDPIASIAQVAPIAQVELGPGEAEGGWHAVLTDTTGAPTDLVSLTGELVWHGERTVWGATAADGSDRPDPPIPLGPVGRYADPETGLHVGLDGCHDPVTGRRLTP